MTLNKNKKILLIFCSLIFFIFSSQETKAAAITADNQVDCPSVAATEILVYFHGLTCPENGCGNGTQWTIQESIVFFNGELGKIRAVRPGVAAAHFKQNSNINGTITAVKSQCHITAELPITIAGHSAGGNAMHGIGDTANKIILLDACYGDKSSLFNYCSKLRVVDGSTTQKYTPPLVNKCKDVPGFKYVNYKNVNSGGKSMHFYIRKYLSEFYLDTESTSGAPTAAPTPKKPFILLDPLLNLQVKLPGLDKLASDTPAVCNTTTDNQTSCSLPWISIYIKALYNYSMGIVGILAALALMIGGVIYLTSAGNATRISEAKSWIGGALTGMLIMFTSYVLLNEVNPDLIGYKPIQLNIVEEEVTAYETAGNELPVGTFTTTDPDCNITYESIAGLPNIDYSSSISALIPTAAKKFRELSAAAQKKGIRLTLTSAARSVATQKRLWEGCLSDTTNKPQPRTEINCRGLVAPPSCKSPHILGFAVDVCITGTASCGHMGAKKASNATYRDCDTWKLEQFMKEQNGWIRYCGEWWHFEAMASGASSRAGAGQTCSGTPQPTNCHW